jgi:hypothetical protein
VTMDCPPYQDPINEKQLTRWRSYAPWLVQFTVPDDIYFSTRSLVAILDELCRFFNLSTPQDLLPAIEEIRLSGGPPGRVDNPHASQEDFIALLKFIPKTLKRVVFKTDLGTNAFIPAFLSHATLNFPYIESFKLMPRNKYFPQVLKDFTSLTRLREVVIPILCVSSDLLYELGLLPSLKALHLMRAYSWIRSDELKFTHCFGAVATQVKRENVHPFSRLRVLLGACIPANNPNDCFRLLSARSLVQLSLLISLSERRDSEYGVIDHMSLFDVISILTQLQILELEFIHCFDFVNMTDSTILQALPTIQLRSLVQLKDFRIFYPWAFGFGGNHIVDASKYWPQLTTFQLRDFYSKHKATEGNLWEDPEAIGLAKPSCRPQILRELLTNLGSLEVLAIDFSPWSNADEGRDDMTIPCSLKTLELGRMATLGVEDSNNRLVEYISKLLPQTQLVFQNDSAVGNDRF